MLLGFLSLIWGWFKSNIKYILLAIVIIAVIIFGNGLVRDYYLNAEKKVDDAKNVVIDNLVDTNKDLVEKNDTQQEHAKIDIEETVNNITEKETIRKDNVKIKDKLKDDIKKINEKYQNIPLVKSSGSTPVNDNRTKEISTVRINALWDTFCSSDITEPECEETK